jgi:hypothetical protein
MVTLSYLGTMYSLCAIGLVLVSASWRKVTNPHLPWRSYNEKDSVHGNNALVEESGSLS